MSNDQMTKYGATPEQISKTAVGAPGQHEKPKETLKEQLEREKREKKGA